MNLQDFDLTGASESYLLANTHLFLISRLQDDPVVQNLSRNFSSGEIRGVLRTSIQKGPDSLEEAVWPYILLVAIFLSGNFSDLQEAAGLPSAKLKWYGLVAATLLASAPPTNRMVVEISPGNLSEGVEWLNPPTNVVTVAEAGGQWSNLPTSVAVTSETKP